MDRESILAGDYIGQENNNKLKIFDTFQYIKWSIQPAENNKHFERLEA